MLTEDFFETILDTISYCEDYLLFLKANNIFDETSELNYIIDDIQKELWSDDILSYYRKNISFSDFAKTDDFYNILGSLTTVKSFIDTLQENELSKCFKINNGMLITVGELKDEIDKNYNIALEEINKEDLER